MSVLSDLKVLYHLTLSPIRGKTHQQRLESFYSGQADQYDNFRKRLLKGREEMYAAVEAPPQAVWIDMGGGTGSNLEYIKDRIDQLGKVYVVDLSTSLLKRAQQRVEEHGWQNVEAVEADATTWQPPEGQVDVITFSYSVTMIPDWFAAIDHAYQLLKPGGILGVVDFYVSRKYPSEAHLRHPWFTRNFWPTWFSNDNVFPNPDHIPYICRKFEVQEFHERRASVPYIPFLRTPYYYLIAKKPGESLSS